MAMFSLWQAKDLSAEPLPDSPPLDGGATCGEPGDGVAEHVDGGGGLPQRCAAISCGPT